ncbi:MAG: 50S ribosomal protein L6, partial [Candidatus Diapherotrites archaeon]|nr:50S ribosomal protein L6 [Candidatus Diapherotrites archaeon]
SPRIARIVGGTKVSVKGKELVISSSNKEDAGQTAANIENATRVKGKDIRVFQDGVYITAKPGK